MGFTEMKQYPIERDLFRKILINVFEDTDLVCECFEKEIETDNFKVWRYDEEVYFLHKDSGLLINWYKPYHFGRCLECNKILTIKEWYRFFRWLRNEVKDEIWR